MTDPTTPSCAAIVVTCNRKALLMECLEALQKQAADFSILVIDNASTDGTDKLVAPLVKAGKIDYRRMSENLGGAGGFCTGIRMAVEMGFEQIWVMDDDSIPEPNALEVLQEFAASHPDYGFLSSKVIWKDGSICLMNEPKFIEGSQKDDKPHKIRQASFVSFFTHAAVVREMGLPIADFFIWGDDVEYTRRISAKYPCWYVPESVVLHKTASNTGSDISRDREERLPRYRYAYRNEVYIARQEGFSRKLYQIAKIGLHTWRILVHAPDLKKERLNILYSASKEGLHFEPRKEFIDDPRS